MKTRRLLQMLFVAAVVTSLVPLNDATAQEPQFLFKWGSAGSGDGQFGRIATGDGPLGMAIDQSGDVYVADTLNHRIQKFTSTGSFITKWGSYGSGDGQFNRPSGVAIDQSGDVYVADQWNHRVQKFTSTGSFLTKWGSYGSGDGEFQFPWNVALDGSGNTYVTDLRNHRIQKFTADRTFITKWGYSNLREPEGIAIDSLNNIYVTFIYPQNNVVKFTSDGTFIKKMEGFAYSTALAVDSAKNIVYVAETHNHQVQVLSSVLVSLGEWGSFGSADGQFYYPSDIAIGPSGNIYVLDCFNHRVQVFGPLFGNTAPAIHCPESSVLKATSADGAVATLTVTVADSDGDALEVKWTIDGTIYQTDLVPSGGATTSANVSFTALFGLGGHEISVSVSDGTANPVSCHTTLVITDCSGETASTTKTVIVGSRYFRWTIQNEMKDYGGFTSFIGTGGYFTILSASGCLDHGGGPGNKEDPYHVPCVGSTNPDGNGLNVFVGATTEAIITGGKGSFKTIAGQEYRFGFTDSYFGHDNSDHWIVTYFLGCEPCSEGSCNTAPTIHCPASAALEANSPDGAAATLTVVVGDAEGDALEVKWTIDGTLYQTDPVPSGGASTAANVSFTALFGLGGHEISVSVSDGTADPVSCQASLSVVDTTPPTILCPANISLACGPELLVPVSFAATATDLADPAPIVTYSQAPGSGFAVGTTVINAKATDASGNQSTCSFTVTRGALEFEGFLSPVGGADASGGSFADPLRTFKLGSTIPLKFKGACGGSALLSGVHTLQTVKWSSATSSEEAIDATPSDAATTGHQFRLTPEQWQFNLDTKATGMTAGVWEIVATLSDGSQHRAWIQIK